MPAKIMGTAKLSDIKQSVTTGVAIPDPNLVPEIHRRVFVALVAYYVFTLFLIPSSSEVQRFSLTYFALVVPLWAYLLASWRWLLQGFGTATVALALFAALGTVTGVVRQDISLAYNASLLGATAIVILNSRVYLRLPELNWIFFGTVLGAIAVSMFGLTDFGVIPRQASTSSCAAAMAWRVSLFRHPATGAVFSLLVLLVNIVYSSGQRNWMRWLALILASYFLVFSGIRTVIIAGLLVTPICLVAALRNQPVQRRRQALGWTAILMAIILLAPAIFTTNKSFWTNYFLRTESCDFQNRYLAPPVSTSFQPAPSSQTPSIAKPQSLTPPPTGVLASQVVPRPAPTSGTPPIAKPQQPLTPPPDGNARIASHAPAGANIPASNSKAPVSYSPLPTEASISQAVSQAAAAIPSDVIQSDWLAWTLNRQCPAKYEILLFAKFPFGTEKIEPQSDRELVDIGCPTDQLNHYCASCNFLTYWLARAGVAALPLFLAFGALMVGALKQRSIHLLAFLAAFAIVSLGWGTLLVPYSFVFLMMLAMPALDSRQRRTSAA